MNEQQIREALLDVLDSVRYWDLSECTRYNGRGHIEYITEADANANRIDFCDAVIAKLKTPILSPEDATKLENATIGERFNHAHFEDVLRVQKQVS